MEAKAAARTQSDGGGGAEEGEGGGRGAQTRFGERGREGVGDDGRRRFGEGILGGEGGIVGGGGVGGGVGGGAGRRGWRSKGRCVGGQKATFSLKGGVEGAGGGGRTTGVSLAIGQKQRWPFTDVCNWCEFV